MGRQSPQGLTTNSGWEKDEGGGEITPTPTLKPAFIVIGQKVEWRETRNAFFKKSEKLKYAMAKTEISLLQNTL